MLKRGRENEEVAKCFIQTRCLISGRMFECKTCGRAFSSFQALGGHRASHHKKKPKPSPEEDKFLQAVKVKGIHECSICGMKFGLGQALGGHMRRHRIEMKGEIGDAHRSDVAQLVPVLMRSLSNNKRIMCMDLNLTPLENDLQVLFGKMAPNLVL